MIKVVFVCHGNICRSPMAEFIFKNMLEENGLSKKVEVCSRATSNEEIYNGVGNPVYPPARAELEKHNILCGNKRAISLTKQDYIIRRLLCRDVVVQGNPRVYKALRNHFSTVLDELKRIEAGVSVDNELLETIQMMTVIMDGLREGDFYRS